MKSAFRYFAKDLCVEYPFVFGRGHKPTLTAHSVQALYTDDFDPRQIRSIKSLDQYIKDKLNNDDDNTQIS